LLNLLIIILIVNFTDWTNSEKEEPMAEEIMTIEECAKYLKTSVSTIIDLPSKAKFWLPK